MEAPLIQARRKILRFGSDDLPLLDRTARKILWILWSVFSQLQRPAQSHLVKRSVSMTVLTLNDCDFFVLVDAGFFNGLLDLLPSHNYFPTRFFHKKKGREQSVHSRLSIMDACSSHMPTRLADGLRQRSVLREAFHDAPRVTP
jgi:hypothetical protein